MEDLVLDDGLLFVDGGLRIDGTISVYGSMNTTSDMAVVVTRDAERPSFVRARALQVPEWGEAMNGGGGYDVYRGVRVRPIPLSAFNVVPTDPAEPDGSQQYEWNDSLVRLEYEGVLCGDVDSLPAEARYVASLARLSDQVDILAWRTCSR